MCCPFYPYFQVKLQVNIIIKKKLHAQILLNHHGSNPKHQLVQKFESSESKHKVLPRWSWSNRPTVLLLKDNHSLSTSGVFQECLPHVRAVYTTDKHTTHTETCTRVKFGRLVFCMNGHVLNVPLSGKIPYFRIITSSY